jgi:hypothetical protein
MIRIEKSEAIDLSQKQVSECYSLTYRSKGEMGARLYNARRNKSKCTCYLAFEKDKLMAWALVYKEKELHIYVRKSKRNMGLGKKLIDKLSKDFNQKTLTAGKHDVISEYFLNQFNFKVINNDQYKTD